MKSSLPLRALFLDIDDTLFSTTAFADTARRNAVAAMIRAGLKAPAEETMQELKEVIREFSSNHERHFDILLQRLPEQAWKGINPAILVASGVMAYHETKFHELKPHSDVVVVLERLARSRLVLGVITAGRPVKQAEKLLRLGLYRFLNPGAIVISDQIGISKPNRKLFLKACQTASVAAAEAMYVGNDPVQDVDPANAAGMVTVKVSREGSGAGRGGETRPDYEIRDFLALLPILKDDFGIDVAS